jgi:hypothetical protein
VNAGPPEEDSTELPTPPTEKEPEQPLAAETSASASVTAAHDSPALASEASAPEEPAAVAEASAPEEPAAAAETPAPEEPALVAEAPAHEAAAEAPAYEQPSPYAYSAPPAGAMAAPRPPRSMAPLIAIIVAAIIVVIGVVGYAGVGYAYAQGRLTSSRSTYNSVVDHENKYTDTINTLNSKLTGTNFTTAASADLTADQTLVGQLITQSQAAGPGIDGDDAALVKADSDLKQNQWLTAISRSDLDKMSTRIGHMRKALADAKTITADYVQLGMFYQTFLTVALDFDTLGTQFQSTSADLTAYAATLDKLKNDTTKAIAQDKAPGLPVDIDTFLKNVQAFTTDLTNLLNAAAYGDTAGVNAAETAAQADATKLDSTNFSSVGNAIDSFYKPLIDDYNAEIDKANNT